MRLYFVSVSVGLLFIGLVSAQFPFGQTFQSASFASSGGGFQNEQNAAYGFNSNPQGFDAPVSNADVNFGSASASAGAFASPFSPNIVPPRFNPINPAPNYQQPIFNGPQFPAQPPPFFQPPGANMFQYPPPRDLILPNRNPFLPYNSAPPVRNGFSKPPFILPPFFLPPNQNLQPAGWSSPPDYKQQSAILSDDPETSKSDIAAKPKNKKRKRRPRRKGKKKDKNIKTTSPIPDSDSGNDSLDYTLPTDVPNDYPKVNYPKGFFLDMLSALNISPATAAAQISSSPAPVAHKNKNKDKRRRNRKLSQSNKRTNKYSEKHNNSDRQTTLTSSSLDDTTASSSSLDDTTASSSSMHNTTSSLATESTTFISVTTDSAANLANDTLLPTAYITEHKTVPSTSVKRSPDRSKIPRKPKRMRPRNKLTDKTYSTSTTPSNLEPQESTTTMPSQATKITEKDVEAIDKTNDKMKPNNKNPSQVNEKAGKKGNKNNKRKNLPKGIKTTSKTAKASKDHTESSFGTTDSAKNADDTSIATQSEDSLSASSLISTASNTESTKAQETSSRLSFSITKSITQTIPKQNKKTSNGKHPRKGKKKKGKISTKSIDQETTTAMDAVQITEESEDTTALKEETSVEENNSDISESTRSQETVPSSKSSTEAISKNTKIPNMRKSNRRKNKNKGKVSTKSTAQAITTAMESYQTTKSYKITTVVKENSEEMTSVESNDDNTEPTQPKETNSSTSVSSTITSTQMISDSNVPNSNKGKRGKKRKKNKKEISAKSTPQTTKGSTESESITETSKEINTLKSNKVEKTIDSDADSAESTTSHVTTSSISMEITKGITQSTPKNNKKQKKGKPPRMRKQNKGIISTKSASQEATSTTISVQNTEVPTTIKENAIESTADITELTQARKITSSSSLTSTESSTTPIAKKSPNKRTRKKKKGKTSTISMAEETTTSTKSPQTIEETKDITTLKENSEEKTVVESKEDSMLTTQLLNAETPSTSNLPAYNLVTTNSDESESSTKPTTIKSKKPKTKGQKLPSQRGNSRNNKNKKNESPLPLERTTSAFTTVSSFTTAFVENKVTTFLSESPDPDASENFEAAPESTLSEETTFQNNNPVQEKEFNNDESNTGTTPLNNQKSDEPSNESVTLTSPNIAKTDANNRQNNDGETKSETPEAATIQATTPSNGETKKDEDSDTDSVLAEKENDSSDTPLSKNDTTDSFNKSKSENPTSSQTNIEDSENNGQPPPFQEALTGGKVFRNEKGISGNKMKGNGEHIKDKSLKKPKRSHKHRKHYTLVSSKQPKSIETSETAGKVLTDEKDIYIHENTGKIKNSQNRMKAPRKHHKYRTLVSPSPEQPESIEEAAMAGKVLMDEKHIYDAETGEKKGNRKGDDRKRPNLPRNNLDHYILVSSKQSESLEEAMMAGKVLTDEKEIYVYENNGKESDRANNIQKQPKMLQINPEPSIHPLKNTNLLAATNTKTPADNGMKNSIKSTKKTRKGKKGNPVVGRKPLLEGKRVLRDDDDVGGGGMSDTNIKVISSKNDYPVSEPKGRKHIGKFYPRKHKKKKHQTHIWPFLHISGSQDKNRGDVTKSYSTPSLTTTKLRILTDETDSYEEDKDTTPAKQTEADSYNDYVTATPPSDFTHPCGLDEEWWECIPQHHNTCENYGETEIPKNSECQSGCFCASGLIQNKDGSCVEPHDCPEPICDDNARTTECVNPCNTCDAVCKSCKITECVPGCDCMDGFKRASNGTCIHAYECPSCSSPEPVTTTLLSDSSAIPHTSTPVSDSEIPSSSDSSTPISNTLTPAPDSKTSSPTTSEPETLVPVTSVSEN